MAGPGIAGVLVQAVGAPFAILLDSLSFLFSGGFIGLIRAAEPPVVHRRQGRSIWREIGEGLQVVFGSPLLRSIAACTATLNLFGAAVQAVAVLFLTRELGLSPGILGFIFAAANVGFLVGALATAPITTRLGLGRAIGLTALLPGLGLLALPLAGGPLPAVVGLLVAAQFVGSLAIPVYNINQVSLRQTITPQRLQGRMNATMRFIVWGTMPLGALFGGTLGGVIGLRGALWVGALGSLLAFFWIWFSPVWSLRAIPAAAETAAAP